MKVILYIVLLMASIVSAGNYIDGITVARADQRYCMINGDCTLTNLTVTNFVNVSYSEVHINATLIDGEHWVNESGDTMTGDLNLNDNTDINFGSGGLTGNLGSDGKMYSDGTNTILQVESPSGLLINPSWKFSYYDIVGDNTYVPSIQVNDANGLGLWGRSIFVLDTTNTNDGFLSIINHDYPVDSGLISITFDTNNNQGKIYTNVTGEDAPPELNLASATGTINCNDDNILTTGDIDVKNITATNISVEGFSNFGLNVSMGDTLEVNKYNMTNDDGYGIWQNSTDTVIGYIRGLT